jgi:hypothetical protein
MQLRYALPGTLAFSLGLLPLRLPSGTTPAPSGPFSCFASCLPSYLMGLGAYLRNLTSLRSKVNRQTDRQTDRHTLSLSHTHTHLRNLTSLRSKVKNALIKPFFCEWPRRRTPPTKCVSLFVLKVIGVEPLTGPTSVRQKGLPAPPPPY